MPQFKLIDVGMGMDICMDKVEAVVVVAIFLGIKLIIINLTIRKTTPITRSLIIHKYYQERQLGHITKGFMRVNATDVE